MMMCFQIQLLSFLIKQNKKIKQMERIYSATKSKNISIKSSLNQSKVEDQYKKNTNYKSLRNSIITTKISEENNNNSPLKKESLYKTVESISYMNTLQGESFLKESIRDEMNQYISKRIKTITKKNEEKIFKNNIFLDDIEAKYETQKNRNIPKNYLSIKLSNLLQNTTKTRTIEKVIGQPFLINYQEKLKRMIQKKKQNQARYQKVKDKIIYKINIEKPVQIKSNKIVTGIENIRMELNHLRQNIEISLKHEQKRYKSRLQKIHSKYTLNDDFQ